MNYNKLIDHTALKANTTRKDIDKLCKEAIEYNFASVCVNSYWVSYCAEMLKGSDVNVCTVIGFPLGANTTASKVFEATDAIKHGAKEIDMVINIGALKDQDYDFIYNDIKAVVDACEGYVVKVIIETCLLTQEEKIQACLAVKKANAAFIKTSTGFSTGGATVEDVKLMKEYVGEHIQVKAAGGVRTFDDMVNVVEAGATRIGTSAGCQLVKGQDNTSGY